jgi:hypothetical protein
MTTASSFIALTVSAVTRLYFTHKQGLTEGLAIGTMNLTSLVNSD